MRGGGRARIWKCPIGCGIQYSIGCAPARVHFEDEMGDLTPEQRAQRWEAARRVRANFSLSFNRCLQFVSNGGFIFRKPLPANSTDESSARLGAPAAPAVPSKAPPEYLLSCDVYVDSDGVSYDELGDPRGWIGIKQRFNIDETKLAPDGFEPGDAMRQLSSEMPWEWEKPASLVV